MAVTLQEKFESRPGDNQSLELIYTIQGTDDDLAAKAALAGSAPGTHGGLVRLDESLHVEPVAPGTWEGRARYAPLAWAPAPAPQAGGSNFSFDTAGGTQHITQSIQTVGKYGLPPKPPAPAFPPPDFQGAIGVSHDNVEGVDITVPVYQFSETHYFADSVVTGAYKAALFFLTGKVNAGPFRGFGVCEVLFLGASGSKRGSDLWEITLRFAASPSVTGLKIGPIEGIDKKGWEYMWVRYADTDDQNAKVVVKRPIAVYVEQVYDLANFANLGIGS